jgi:PAS domain S-box-containing protein
MTLCELEEDRLTRAFRVVFAACLTATLFATLSSVLFRGSARLEALLVTSFCLALAWLVFATGRTLAASLLLVVALVVTAHLLMVQGLGLQDQAMMLYPVAIIVSAVLLGTRGTFATVALSSASTLLVAWHQATSGVEIGARPLTDALQDALVVLVVTGTGVALLVRDIVATRDLAQEGAAVIRDAHDELQQQAQALRASEAGWRSLVETAPDRIVSVGPDLRILFANEPPPEGEAPWVGRNTTDLVPPDSKEKLEAVLQEAFASGAPGHLELPGWDRDGNPAWWDTRVGPVREGDQISSVTLVATNAWSRKQAEAEREALMSELESRNAELESFTYTVSHDLKSPLITIRGFLGFVAEAAEKGDVVRLRGDLARIVSATERMERLLTELLHLSRLGRMVSTPMQLPFATVAREAVALVHGSLTAGRIHVHVESHLPTVWGDRTRLVEVVQNLLENSIKFMGEQQRPEIVIGSRESLRPGEAILFVKDNGVGIEPDQRDRVFGLFNKLDPKSSGSGVGLTVVKRIVEVHGGRVWLESAGSGRGTTACIALRSERRTI